MTMFSLSEDTTGKSLAIFYANGDQDTIPSTHPSFNSIIKQLMSGKAKDEDIRELANVLETVATKMSSLSERVTVDGKQVYFDGDPLDTELAKVIKGLFEQGRSLDFKPLVNFLEKAKTNPSLKSVDDLFRWIKNGDLVIDHEGDIIAYKAVQVNKDGKSESISSGTAYVNGEKFTGHIPNVPGTVVTMPRSEVDANSFVDCSYGLHAGTHAYATLFQSWKSGMTTRLILVKINPRDVVSVPHDHESQKMRVSRYTVLHETEERQPTAFYSENLPDEVEDEDEGWYDEDEDYEWDEDYEDEDEEEDEAVEPTPELSEAARHFTDVLNGIAENSAHLQEARQTLFNETPPAPEVKRDSSGRKVF